MRGHCWAYKYLLVQFTIGYLQPSVCVCVCEYKGSVSQQLLETLITGSNNAILSIFWYM
jgi:hypothetical protein